MKKFSVLLALPLLLASSSLMATATVSHPLTTASAKFAFPSVEARNAYFQGQADAKDWQSLPGNGYSSSPSSPYQQERQRAYDQYQEDRAIDSASLDSFYDNGYYSQFHP